MAIDPRRVVERYLHEVLSGAGSATADELIASEEVRQRTAGFLRAFPDLDVQALLVVAEGEHVAAHFVARGTHRGLFDGAPPTGRQWEACGTAIYRVVDGRIADAWVTWDRLSLLEQLDAVRRVETVSA